MATIGYLIMGFVFVLDKFILEKSVSKPVVYTFYSTIFMFVAFLAYPFGVTLLRGMDWVWALVAGLTFGFGLWTMFKAVETGETSHISPFLGAVIAILTYGMSSLFLQEVMNAMQIVGILFLVFASMLLSFEKSKKHSGFHVGFLWAIFSGLLFAVSHVSTKYIYGQYDFLTGLVWTRAFIGIVGMITLFFPSVRKVFKKNTKKPKKEEYAEKHVVAIVITNKVLAVIGVIAIQYAIAVGSVTLVNALAGMQFAFMFLIIITLTKFAPKVFKEFFTNRELVQEWIAIFFILIGSGLLVL
ncbi:MAG: EamA family transporter [Candidatus Magasanikbacteria bacterium]